MAYQAITTKYVGPTSHRGTRVIATSAGGHRHTMAWKYELDSYQNHRKAAEELARKLGWTGTLHGGSTKNGYAFVFDEGGRDRSRRRSRARTSARYGRSRTRDGRGRRY